MNLRKLFFLPVIVALVGMLGVTQVFAGDVARIGTAAGVQVQVPVGARDLAMGGANLAYTRGLDALFWNPAGLSYMQHSAAGSFSTMSLFNDVDLNYAAIGVRMGELGALGFSIKTFDFGEIPLTTNADPDGLAGQTFSPTMITAALTYAKRLTDGISFGVTGKLVHESVPRASASAFAFDAGIQYHQLGGINGLSFGIAVKNIGTNLRYSGSALLGNNNSSGTSPSGQPIEGFLSRPAASNQLPANVELGVGYRRNINEQNAVTVTGTFDSQNFGDDSFKFGAEYMFAELIALRGGYLLANSIESNDQLYRFTLGVGLHYAFGSTDVTFDYTFRDSQYFDGNNMFSIQLAF